MSQTRRFAYLALLLTAVIWGFAPPIIKYTLGFISPTLFLFYRFLFASIFFIIPLSFKIIKNKPNKKEIFQYLALGFLGTPLTLFLLFSGIQRTTAIDSTIIGIITPILVIMGGVFFLKEKLTKMEAIGVSLALAGTMVTIVQPFLEAKAQVSQNIYGNFLVLLGTITWAAFTLITKKLCRHLDFFVLSASSFLIGLFCFTTLMVIEKTPFLLPANAIWGVLYMAILGSVVAYSTYIYGVSKIEASEATVFTYLQPVFAVPASILLLGEKTTAPFWTGAILIVAGVFICEFRRKV